MAKLFEQGADVTPELNKRVAWGLLGTATSNSTWQTIVTWLENSLGFLKTSNNLSDLNSASTARTNLDVYDTTTIDNAIDLKADKSNVLERDNTDVYTPTSSYHPSTKKYVDDKLIVGEYAFGDGPATKTVSIGQTLSSSNYKVFLTNTSTAGSNVSYWATVLSKTTTTFDIQIAEDAGAIQDLTFDWLIVR